jgi:hypothetical protein
MTTALLDRLKPIRSAFFDATEAAPACLKGTRAKLLADIERWMKDMNGERIYWLTGVAGTGKTTVAQSVASWAQDHQCLAASFFFSRTRGVADLHRSSAVIPTIAYQLARKHSELRGPICDALSSHVDICESMLSKQAKTLISDALSEVNVSFLSPLIVVLDALDECDKEDGREGGNLIPLLLHHLKTLPFSVKIFVTSRPEASISNMFGRPDIKTSMTALALHRDIETELVRDDISLYLRHELDQIARNRDITPPFPSRSDLSTLVHRAGALFIYARTIVLYVSNDCGDPRSQLAAVLGGDPSRTCEHFDHLDELYTQILTKALDTIGRGANQRRRFLHVLVSLVLVQETVPVNALAALAGIEIPDCEKILRCLSSVLLSEPQNQDHVRVVHPSFPDFLVSFERCSDPRWMVDVPRGHSQLAERCLQILNKHLRQNICSIEDPSLPNSDVADLDERLADVAPAELRHACKYWQIHVRLANGLSKRLISLLGAFTERHLLHWLELLSLIDEMWVVLTDTSSSLDHLRVSASVVLNTKTITHAHD